MTTHSSILAWRLPCREESGRLQSTGLQGGTQLSQDVHSIFFIHSSVDGHLGCVHVLTTVNSTTLEKVSFHSNPKKRQCQRMFKLPYNCAHFTSQQGNAQNPFLDVQTGFRKGRGTINQIVNIHWIIEKAKEFQKNIYFCFIDYVKAFNFTTNSGKFLKRWEYQTTLPAS